MRDGYRCVVTGRYDAKHPQVPPEDLKRRVDLEASHILHRAVAVFKKSSNNEEYLSALTTFDILRHYADLPIKNIEDIAHIIDDPSNGIALQADAHKGFDKFRWSLKETNIKNVYKTVIHEDNAAGIEEEGQLVTFADHSRDFMKLSESSASSSRPRKKLRSGVAGDASSGIALPNPLFIRIHGAIAGVLYMSGAGESIDKALDRAGESATEVVLTGNDFAHLGLRENLEALMSQVAVR